MPDPGFTTKDILTLGLAGGSLLVTIVWNLSNRWHTDRVAKQMRIDSFSLDEWRGQRIEILRALREFEDTAGRVVVLAKGAHARDALITEVNNEAASLAPKHIALLRELERPGFQPCWGPLAYGLEEQGESDWDRLNSVLEDIVNLQDADQIRQQLQLIEAHVRGIAKQVNDQIRSRNHELHPNH